MRLGKLLTCLIVTLIAFTLVSRAVSAQIVGVPTAAKITNVVAPDTVVAGQPLTVTITTSYSNDYWGVVSTVTQILFIGIVPHTEVGNPFPTTASSCPSQDFPNEALCMYNPSSSTGDFTVSFTLTAPNYATTWLVIPFAQIVQLQPGTGYSGVTNPSYVVLHVVVTAG